MQFLLVVFGLSAVALAMVSWNRDVAADETPAVAHPEGPRD